MPQAPSKIRFKAKLQRPAANVKIASSAFLILPQKASSKLASRGLVAIAGTINGIAFRAVLQPDGQAGHWLKLNRKLLMAAGVAAGDAVTLEMTPVPDEPEPRVPTDVRQAFAAAPKARALWKNITPKARRDWIHWITSTKQPKTRMRRVASACAMLGAGKRRVCCFDRSGIYSKAFKPPTALAGK
ncbi:MAG: DUF1905 domain-containing protein [Phycisphaerales bacterium]|nr:DUF1905 domain-containing protein [Phycisphaerales bacterium]